MNSLTVSAWLLTYLIHSTVLLGAAWLVTRRGRLQPAATDLLWKVALIAPLITGTLQSGLDLRSPAAVHLPVAEQPIAALNATPADLPKSGGPAVTPAPTAPVVSSPRALPSLTSLVVVFWAIVALGSALYYIARRLILVGRLADRRAVSGGSLSAMLDDLKREVGHRRSVSSPTIECCTSASVTAAL